MAKLTQEDLLDIFKAVKAEIAPYERGTITARVDTDGKYDLWSEKELTDPLGKRRTEMAFAALIIQSGYVGFYFMPVYSSDAMKEAIHPDLLKLLKGKACFHIKTVTPELLTHIADALSKGYSGYKERGWAA